MIDFALRRASNIHHQKPDDKQVGAVAADAPSTGRSVVYRVAGRGKVDDRQLVEARLHARGTHTALLDGDNVRHGLNRDLGFTEADRVENIRRIGEVAKLMTESGLVVLCSFISPFRAERRIVRELLDSDEFLEVFVDTPLAECMHAIQRALSPCARWPIKNFTGVDQPYEVPENPELHLLAGQERPETLAQQVIDELVRRSMI